MNLRLNIRKLFEVARGDISAVLIIAFAFQMVTPIVVLADTTSFDRAFETSLRYSICRVEIRQDDDSSAPIAHTDGFVCDWCVLCSVGSSFVLERLPDVHVETSSLAESSPAFGSIEALSLTLASRDKSSSPRGPPELGNLQSLTDDVFLTFATFKEFPSAKDT